MSLSLNNLILLFSLILGFACNETEQAQFAAAPPTPEPATEDLVEEPVPNAMPEPEPEPEPTPEPEPMLVQEPAPPPPLPPPPPPPPAPIVKLTACEQAAQNGSYDEIIYEIKFEATNNTGFGRCGFQQEGGPVPENAVLAGKYRQTVPVNIEEGRELCDLKLDFTLFNAQEKQMQYDDILFMTVQPLSDDPEKSTHEFLIASTWDYSSLLVSEDNLLIYDWSKLDRKKWSYNANSETKPEYYEERPFCLGGTSEDLKAEECTIPQTDVKEPFNIKLSDPISKTLAQKLMEADSQIEFSFIIAGDNDDFDKPEYVEQRKDPNHPIHSDFLFDCEHDQDFFFNVIFYYAK